MRQLKAWTTITAFEWRTLPPIRPPPAPLCQGKVAECDIFVCVLGDRYGSCPPGYDVSYTELEYNAAEKEDKVILPFVAPEDFPVPANLIESEIVRAKQKAFRQRILGNKHIKSFKSNEDLATKVVQAIHNSRVDRIPGVDRTSGVSLLFPWVCNQAGFDSGVVVVNASASPFGKTPKSGTCVVHFYGSMSDSDKVPAPQVSSLLQPGEHLTFTLSGGNPTQLIKGAYGFQGYLVAECDFPDAHGYSFMADGFGGIPNLAAGYLAHRMNV